MKYFFFIATLTAALMTSNTSIACKPAPPANTNWLQIDIKFEEATIPKGLSAKARGTQVSFEFPEGSKALYRNPHWPKNSSHEWDELPTQIHIVDAANVRLEEGSIPIFGGSKPQKSIPNAQSFEIPISLYAKRHTLKGKIVYSRNPNFDPNAMKKWKNPCAGVPGS